MVSPVRTFQQGQGQHAGQYLPQRDPAGGWGERRFAPLSAASQRIMLKASPLDGSARLVYAILLMHADYTGRITFRMDELAEAANMQPETVRHILSGMQIRGAVRRVIPGTRWHRGTWQLVGLNTAA